MPAASTPTAARRPARHADGDRRVQREGRSARPQDREDHTDTETTPATGSRVAERITREECGFLIGAVHSGVANAISQVAQKYGVIYLNTNSSSPSEAGENCPRVKFVWDGNGTNFAKAAVNNSIEMIGKSGCC